MMGKIMLYKLTDRNKQTGHSYVPTTWEVGFRPPRLSGEGDLCGPGWYHAYEHPLLAALHYPIHIDFDDPLCCMVECKEDDIGRLKGQLKVGFREGVMVGWVDLPQVTTVQRIAYAIHCALEVYDEPKFVRWAHDWLSGKDRTVRTASSAAGSATDAAEAAKKTNAGDIVRATAWAASASACAAAWGGAKEVRYAARSVAESAEATWFAGSIDLLPCAKKAMCAV